MCHYRSLHDISITWEFEYIYASKSKEGRLHRKKKSVRFIAKAEVPDVQTVLISFLI